MLGQMQDKPLLISSLLEHAERFHPNVDIVTRTAEGPIHRCNWRELGQRSRRLALALQKKGVRQGSMVATLATNTYRHLELYFAVMGIGAVLHTINPRLSPAHLEYIVNHAEDEMLFFDLAFAPSVEKLQSRFPTVKRFYALGDQESVEAAAPAIRDFAGYETLFADTPADPSFPGPQFDERSASTLKDILYRGEWWARARNARLRTAAARALRSMGTPGADRILQDAADSAPGAIRKIAKAALNEPATQRRRKE